VSQSTLLSELAEDDEAGESDDSIRREVDAAIETLEALQAELQ
jgi:hypothetical protein